MTSLSSYSFSMRRTTFLYVCTTSAIRDESPTAAASVTAEMAFARTLSWAARRSFQLCWTVSHHLSRNAAMSVPMPRTVSAYFLSARTAAKALLSFSTPFA